MLEEVFMMVSELKKLYYKNNPDGHYFDRETMRFFGDTMRNFGVRDAGLVKFINKSGRIEEIEAVVLYRKRPVKCGLYGDMDFFSKDTGQVIYSPVRKRVRQS